MNRRGFLARLGAIGVALALPATVAHWRNVAREQGRARTRRSPRRTDFGARWANPRPHVTSYRPFLSKLICTAPGYNATVTLT